MHLELQNYAICKFGVQTSSSAKLNSFVVGFVITQSIIFVEFYGNPQKCLQKFLQKWIFFYFLTFLFGLKNQVEDLSHALIESEKETKKVGKTYGNSEYGDLRGGA